MILWWVSKRGGQLLANEFNCVCTQWLPITPEKGSTCKLINQCLHHNIPYDKD